jgi:hypothetical protein
VIGFMRGWTLRSPKRHAADCNLAECLTCDNPAEALSLYTAYEIEKPPSPEAFERRGWLPHDDR